MRSRGIRTIRASGSLWSGSSGIALRSLWPSSTSRDIGNISLELFKVVIEIVCLDDITIVELNQVVSKRMEAGNNR